MERIVENVEQVIEPTLMNQIPVQSLCSAEKFASNDKVMHFYTMLE